ncbi:MAG TPA: hypothetical protein VFE50_08415 [Cyclobacteriaceae bacterium]|nr:hypothetical protein [Cyclobacteriaceae bacterium]
MRRFFVIALLIAWIDCSAQVGVGIMPGGFMPFKKTLTRPSNAFESDVMVQLALAKWAFQIRIPVMTKSITVFEQYTPLGNQNIPPVESRYNLYDVKLEAAYYIPNTQPDDHGPWGWFLGASVIPFVQIPLEKRVSPLDTQYFEITNRWNTQVGGGLFTGVVYNGPGLPKNVVVNLRVNGMIYPNIEINNYDFNQFGNAALRRGYDNMVAISGNVVFLYYFR